jgi:hypothetical protein
MLELFQAKQTATWSTPANWRGRAQMARSETFSTMLA